MEWLKKIMRGRYGSDKFSRELLIFSLILLILISVLPGSLWMLSILAYIPAFICILRIFSKNIYKRQMENYNYLRIRNNSINYFKRKSKMLKDLKTHKYFKCPNCKQSLRVPRKQGKISITCPKCKTSFKAKS